MAHSASGGGGSSGGGAGLQKKRVDSVDCIMDKIDSELLLLNAAHAVQGKSNAVPSATTTAMTEVAAAKCLSPSKALLVNDKCPVHSAVTTNSSTQEASSQDTPSSNGNDVAESYESESIASLHTEEFETAFQRVMVQQTGGDSKRTQRVPESAITAGGSPLTSHIGNGSKSTAAGTGLAKSPLLIPKGQTSKLMPPVEYVSDDTETCDEFSDLELEMPAVESCGVLPTGVNLKHDAKDSRPEGKALADEISKQSLSVLKEIQKERMLRQRALAAARRVVKQEREKPEVNLGQEPEDGQPSVDDMKQEKLVLLLEISNLRTTAKNLEETINQMEHLAKSNQARAEEARSQLMVAEFKKKSLSKDIEKLAAELQNKRSSAAAAAIHAEGEPRKRSSLCKSPSKECSSPLGKHFAELIEERQRMTEMLEQHQRAAQLEKKAVEEELLRKNSELMMECRALSAENLSREQELKGTLAKLDAANNTVADLNAKLHISDARMKQAQEESIRITLEKSREIEDLRNRTQKDMMGMKAEIAAEVSTIVSSNKMSEERLSQLQAEHAQKSHELEMLRQQLTELQQAIASRDKDMASLERDYNSKLDSLTRSKNDELLLAKKQAAEQSKRELANQKELLETREKKAALIAVRDHAAELEALQKSVQNREAEIAILKQTLAAQEDSFQRALKVVRLEEQQKFDDALAKERSKWEQEWQETYNEQVSSYKDDLARHVQQLREQFDYERTLVQQLQQKNVIAVKELQEQRRINARTAREHQNKQDASAKALKKLQDEIEKIKAKLEKEKAAEVRHLTEALDGKDKLLEDMKQHHEQLANRVKEANTTLEKVKDAVVVESNDECAKMAGVLGVTACKVETSRILLGDSLDKKPAPLSVTLAALANLRACNEELRNYIGELKASATKEHTRKHELLAKLKASTDDDVGRTGTDEPPSRAHLQQQQQQQLGRVSPRRHCSGNSAPSLGSSAAINAELSRQLDIYLNRKERQQIRTMVDHGQRIVGTTATNCTPTALMTRSLRGDNLSEGGSAYKEAILKKLQLQLRQVNPYITRRTTHGQRSSSEHSLSLNDLSLLASITGQDLGDRLSSQSGLVQHTATGSSNMDVAAPKQPRHHSRRSGAKDVSVSSKPPLSRLHSQSLSSL